MPNPTSKLNLVINGVTTQLDIHDANAVDLTSNQTVGGNKEFTGTTTAHDLVPSATDTYNFGSSSYQWSNAYIKSLTINGVACGDILTHNASEFVGVSGDQTIRGEKNFASLQKMKSLIINPTASIYKVMYGSTEGVIGPYGAGTVPESSVYPFRFYVGKGRSYADAPIVIDTAMGPTGNTTLVLRAASNEINALDHRVNIGTSVTDNGDETKTRTAYVQFYNTNEIRPNKNNYCNLGTASNKWANVGTNAINRINPGALSLPGTSVNVDTTNWVLDGSNVNIFTPASDGWLGIQATDTVYDQMHYIFVGRNDSASYYQQNVMSPINALWDSKYHGCIFIPVVKNYNYDIRCICSTIVATFYPCQGNV